MRMHDTPPSTPVEPAVSPAPRTPSSSSHSFLSDAFRFVLIAVLIVAPIRLLVAQPFIVSGSSMTPTFANGEYLIVDQLSYRFHEPERGDVLIFRFPGDTSKFFIKRIIGLPNETISANRGTITIHRNYNGTEEVLSEPYVSIETPDTYTVTLGNDEYFVLGDNRPASSDSRIWGTLKRSHIVGRAYLRLFPFTKIDFLPGRLSQ